MGQVKLGYLLVQNLGKDVDANLQLLGFAELDIFLAKCLILALVQHDLRKDLVRERTGHDKRGVARGTSQVDEAAFGEENNMTPTFHEVAVHLWLDVGDTLGILLQPRDIDFDVEMANICRC